MKRRWNKNNVMCFLVCVIASLLLACDNTGKTNHVGHSHKDMDAKSRVFTCPMHPEIIRNEPGVCPICGMDLVKKGISDTDELTPDVLKATSENTIGQTKLISPVKKTLSTTVEAKGYISYNPKNTFSISSRYTGRIDKLYVKYNFQEVTKGQKLMDVYSPELVTAQQNYILLLNSETEESSLLETARSKLLLLGMDERQVNRIRQTRKAEYLVSIYATAGGHIHQVNSQHQLTMSVMPEENSNNSASPSLTEISIREGMYVTKGEAVFTIISLSQVWAILKIYPEDVSKIKTGQEVEIISETAPDYPIQAKVSFIEPILEKDSKFVSVRVYLNKMDHHRLKIGSLIHGVIATGKSDGFWIPASATIDLGNGRHVVFKKQGSRFKAVDIIVHHKMGQEINVWKSLSATDTIAADASYRIDSESFVTTKE